MSKSIMVEVYSLKDLKLCAFNIQRKQIDESRSVRLYENARQRLRDCTECKSYFVFIKKLMSCGGMFVWTLQIKIEFRRHRHKIRINYLYEFILVVIRDARIAKKGVFLRSVFFALKKTMRNGLDQNTLPPEHFFKM